MHLTFTRQVWKKRDRVLVVTMPLRRVTEAAYERHRQKLAESASAGTVAHAASSSPAPTPAASSAKAGAAVLAAPPSVHVAAAGSSSAVAPAPDTNAAVPAALPQAPPTANPVAPTPTLFHFECLRCGFSSKQSSKTVPVPSALSCFRASDPAPRCVAAADGSRLRDLKLGMMLLTPPK